MSPLKGGSRNGFSRLKWFELGRNLFRKAEKIEGPLRTDRQTTTSQAVLLWICVAQDVVREMLCKLT
jgi:hypothetical protein